MLPEWFKKPEVIYTTMLAVIGIAVALYPTHIRRGLRWPRQMMTRGMIRSLLKFSKDELAALELLHNNPYNLVLWLAWNLFSLVKWVFWGVVAGAILNFAIYFITKDVWYRSPLSLIWVLPGVIYGRGGRLSGTLRGLFHFDTTTATLKNTIEECNKLLAILDEQKERPITL
jgi:hypothetical protein